MPPSFLTMAERYPQIKFRSPELEVKANSLLPEIIIEWNEDMEVTQFSNAVNRAQRIMLVDDANGDQLATDFVSYTAGSNRLILKPSASLHSNKTYRVFVRKGIKSSFGRSSKTDYNWYFTTSASELAGTDLTYPANFSILDHIPTFSWEESIASIFTINYKFQLSSRFDFETINIETETSSTSFTPAVPLPKEVTYYWRVRTATDTVTGDWSDVWSFYYGDYDEAKQSSRVTYPTADTFGVTKTGFDNGASNLSSFPEISFTFSSTPASSGYSSFFTVLGFAQIPRNDTEADNSPVTVPGTWAISGKKITFTPSVAISGNTRYEITIDEDLVNVDGSTLGERLEYYFTGPYSPMYTTSRIIQGRLRSEGLTLPVDYINFNIYRAGLIAQARFQGYLYGIPNYLLESLAETLVRDSTALKSFAVGRYTESLVIYEIVNSILIDELRNIGRSRQLADYKESLTKDFLDAMKLLLNKAKEELDEWAEFLTPNGIPIMVSPHSLWSPFNRMYDYSLMDIEGRRTPDTFGWNF